MGSNHYGPWEIHLRPTHTLSIGCHCKQHKGCAVNKVSTKQPIGYFMAWLDTKFKDRESHMKARFDRVGVVSFERRQAGRQRAQNDPQYMRLFHWEVPENGEEPKILR